MYSSAMKSTQSQACEAWQLLVKFFFSQRADLPSLTAQFELSPAQCHVLHLMEPGESVSMGMIAEALACDASNVTGLVDRLEARRLIRRRPSAEDRRVKVLELTPAGTRLRSTVLRKMTRPPDIFGRLSEKEQHALVQMLRRLLE